MVTIPEYRARKIYKDEYVEGYLCGVDNYENLCTIRTTDEVGCGGFICIQSTLAIHHPDMLDSDGKKIFASLSEDGKGGDILKYTNKFNVEHIRTLQFTNLKLLMVNENSRTQIFNIETLDEEEVIGIQK